MYSMVLFPLNETPMKKKKNLLYGGNLLQFLESHSENHCIPLYFCFILLLQSIRISIYRQNLIFFAMVFLYFIHLVIQNEKKGNKT